MDSSKMKLVKRFRGLVWTVLNATSPPLLQWVSVRFAKSCADNWKYRTKMVQVCPDNSFIPRVPEAGHIIDGLQTMHNGIKVHVGSYYGMGASGLLQKNTGVHEPQEERVFQEVLKVIPPGKAILELGAYWAFYSMWFCKTVPNGRAYMVEPMAENLLFGQKNFKVNGLEGDFTRGYVGEKPGTAQDGVRIIAVDPFLQEKKIEDLAILHSDIQGFEMDMLKGAEASIKAGKIWFFFISTHSEQLHRDCEAFFLKHGCQTLASVSPAESYSFDGILVCRAPHAPAMSPIPVAKRLLQD